MSQFEERENEVFMSPDPKIPGQNFCVLSIVSPEDIIKQKETFYLQSFLNHLLNDNSEHAFLDESRGREVSYHETEDLYKGFVLREGDRLQAEFDEKVDFQTNVRGLKVRGVYDSEREAHYRAKQLWKRDPSFNVWVGRVGEWLPFNPDPNKMQDVEYNNDKLNELMKNKRKADQERDEVFNEEVKRKMERAHQENAEKKKAIEVITEPDSHDLPDEDGNLNGPTVGGIPDATADAEAESIASTAVSTQPDLDETKEKIGEFREILDEKDAIFEKIMAEKRQAQAKVNAAPAPVESGTDSHGVDKETTNSLFGAEDPWLARKKEQSEKKDISKDVKSIF